ncbi:MAG: MMPL family transporter [Propionibacteriaceae bacterium]|jgi:RND superfamily putative drug exporter|nr:MMPL family transporter [Propionibacteriaceae bacterium]
MFDKLGVLVAHHPWRFIVVWILVTVVAAMGALWGFGQGGLFDRLDNSTSLVKGTDSDEVNELTSSTGGESVTIVVTGLDLESDAAAVTQFMADHRADLADIDDVDTEADPFLFPDPTAPQAQAMMSDKSDGFIIAVTLKDGLSADDSATAEAAVADATTTFSDDLAAEFDGASATLVSQQSMTDSVIGQVQKDLVKGESVGLPVALLLLIIVFGGLLAAGLPILGAIIAIGVGMGIIWALTFSITVEAFILNIISIIGLALSIDYGLLVVSRYREELARVLTDDGYPLDGSRLPDKDRSRHLVAVAVRRTIATAGRTVTFSAMTIAFALAGLLVMKADMLKIIAASGIVVAILAVLAAITVVPSLIVILNRKLIKPSVITRVPGLRSLVKAVGDSSSDHGVFSKLARGVNKHPWIVMLGVIIILGVMAFPLRELQARTSFTDYLPEDAAVTAAYNTIQDDYPALKASTITVVADAAPADTADLVTHLESFDDVSYVSAPAALPDDANRTVINVTIDVENQVGQQIIDDVEELRGYDAGYDILVGGPAALQQDFVESIIDGLPLALTIIIVAVFILMFLMTGSLIVPIKALVINSLSLVASFGATSWIFMEGHLGMPQQLGLETFILACIACFGFGLAMDYEVFLLARIKEYYDAGVPNDEAVERGLQRSGRIITSAAAIIVAVFIGFTFGEMIPIKEAGVALAITVITDATLVRMLLVPATMTILGKWNWWSPKPLRKLYSKVHLVH